MPLPIGVEFRDVTFINRRALIRGLGLCLGDFAWRRNHIT